MNELALRFVAKIDGIDNFILGINSVEELKLNIKIIDKKFPKKIFDEIMDVTDLEIDSLNVLSGNINKKIS